jgi:hypothetical protein
VEDGEMFEAVCSAKAGLILALGIFGGNSTHRQPPFSFAPCRNEGNKLVL